MKKILIPLGVAIVIGAAIYTSFKQSEDPGLLRQNINTNSNTFVPNRPAIIPSTLNACKTYEVSAKELAAIFGKITFTEINLPQFPNTCPQVWQSDSLSLNIRIQSTYGTSTLRNNVSGPCIVSAPTLGIGTDSCFDKFSDQKTTRRLLIVNKSAIVNISVQTKTTKGIAAKLPSDTKIVNLGKLVVNKM